MSSVRSGTAPSSAPMLSGSMNWEPVRSRLLGADLNDALQAATELRENIEIVHSTEFPLMLSALLPAFSSVLAHRTRPSPDTRSVEHKFRHMILEIISKFPSNEVLRPHAPHLVALAMDILNRDYEENALLASKIIFDLYKTYRSLPQDYVQPYLDFVVGAYRALPTAVQRNFAFAALAAQSAATTKTDKSEAATKAPAPAVTTEEQSKQEEEKETAKAPAPAPAASAEETSKQKKKGDEKETTTEKTTKEPEPPVRASPSGAASVDSTGTSPSTMTTPVQNTPPRLSLRSNASFRVLTECPLIVMLMFQLYPKFLKGVPILINVMMEALALRAPSLQSIAPSDQKVDSNVKRLYFSRARELVAAQAKTLSFLTYLLRSFSNELKPYEDRLATNVVALMTTCPRESISTRKELLVATRHLLSCDFRKGFFRHVDALLDERVLMGSHHRYSDQTLLRPLGYTTLSDLVQHVRSLLSMTQMSRVVIMFSRVLHDSSMTLPMSTQYAAVRTLLSVVDIIYSNKDPNAQLGRDMLVRILNTMVEKLEALINYFPKVLQAELERAREGSDRSVPPSDQELSAVNAQPDSVRDVQSLIRAIVVGNKTVIYYIHNYRNQREKEKTREQMIPPPGSNEEVASAMHKMTHTEVEIVDRYILAAFSAIKILKEKGLSAGQLAGRAAGEKTLAEHHREALTYFAAAFTALDGYSLRRTLGKRLSLLVDAIVLDPMVMVVPRHVLASNPATSFEFCSMLMDYLVPRMDGLSNCRPKGLLYIEQPSDRDASEKDAVREQLRIALQHPVESDEMLKQRSAILLQLFERILKSLSAYPDNEAVVRRHLRRIVVVCLRSSMENTDAWPDNYCMLLRYIFRSISAGKFEESYKELLLLIPTVLNGLYRVVCATEDSVIRHTAIELCLTIPARLSSLLPHMNLLLRVIVPSLDASSGDLVNLGLRTLEFWVDNLNPLFLYPEISKQTELFASLMQALSRHLRPAPYPYGLLTLRLLGKLGGKNRQFLREPLVIYSTEKSREEVSLTIECSWNDGEAADGSIEEKAESPASVVSLPLSIDRCVEILKSIALAQPSTDMYSDSSTGSILSEDKEVIPWRESSQLWNCRIENVDLSAYSRDVIEETKKSQAIASLTVLQTAIGNLELVPGEENDISVKDVRTRRIVMGLLFACAIEYTEEQAKSLVKDMTTRIDPDTLSAALVGFLSEPSSRTARVGIDVLKHMLEVETGSGSLSFNREDFCEGLVCGLCEACSSSSWGRLVGIQDAIGLLIEKLGIDWASQYEVKLVNASLLPIKSIPRELSTACVQAFRFFVRVCTGLYGVPRNPVLEGGEEKVFWDVLYGDGEKNMKKTTKMTTGKSSEEQTKRAGESAITEHVSIKESGDSKEAASRTGKEIGGPKNETKISSSTSGGTDGAAAVAGEKNDGSEGAPASSPEKLTGESKVATEEPRMERRKSEDKVAEQGNESGESKNASAEPEKDSSESKNDADALGKTAEELEDGNSSGEGHGTVIQPANEVVRIVLHEIACPQQLVRFAARFLLTQYVIPVGDMKNPEDTLVGHLSLVRRVLFSRSLRLLPLPHQVGVVEGLGIIVKQAPKLLPLSDQHLLAFLSELLKMSSVADGEMQDPSLKEFVIDKNGYAGSQAELKSASYPTHASALFFRRECVLEVNGDKFVVPEELPAGIQLRVSSIVLLHSVIRGYSDSFFEAKTSTPIGNIRPHVVSLLFRSLVSTPSRAVAAAYNALRDVLALSVVTKISEEGEGSKSQSRLPKELLQTCIRPVLLNLRDYTRLSISLLRGLSRLLSLLSSWFNKTLGEKLLDHLQQWTDPGRIASLKIWKEGEEPLVAAAIVDIFPLLPHAFHFVEPLVKTCIKLEATLPAYKARYVESPYRRPLAKYLNKHAQHAAGFFFQRLKTPIYSELFQSLVKLEEASELRAYLSNKQFSVMILNICFEKPLAIIRSEKSSSSSTRASLAVHGIGQANIGSESAPGGSSVRPMNIESLELQYQGFRLVDALLANNSRYFQDHNDIVRAFRWLWRSKGRFLRLQHEDVVSPRFHSESKMLASFLISYSKSFPNEDLDILFELIRVFLQASTEDFSFVSRFLREMVSHTLTLEQKKQILQRFFALLAGESNEETKVLAIQFLVFPMLSSSFGSVKAADVSMDVEKKPTRLPADQTPGQSLIDRSMIEKFVKEVLFQRGTAINCGDRLRVELLRLMNLFVEHVTNHVEPFRKEMVRFCWGLIKSEDMSCKSWAYVVVCRFVSVFETPVKIVLQVYTSLLRSHQQESRELIRYALDLLVPSLPKRLPDGDFLKAIDQASQLMLEDGSSTPQLAHICSIIVRNPTIFHPHRSRFVGYMTNSLNRLGLPSNCPHESRVLAVDVVGLLLDWEQGPVSSKLMSSEHVDTIANFLVRLKILLAEPSDGRSPKIDVGASSLDGRVLKLFRGLLAKRSPDIRSQPFEKVAAKGRSTPVPLFSCLDIFSALIEVRNHAFLMEHSQVVNDIISGCFTHARDDPQLQDRLRAFAVGAMAIPPLGTVVIVSLEKIIIDAIHDQKKSASNRGAEASRQGTSRSREKSSATEDTTVGMTFAVFAIELVADLCCRQENCLEKIGHALLSLASILAKNHLLEAAAKQRQGSSSAPRGTVTGIMAHTPTKGILEEACTKEAVVTSRPAYTKNRSGKDTPDSITTLRALLVILSVFETSDMPYTFTHNRKVLFQILFRILDSSDNIQLLMISTRIIGKWLLTDDLSGPVTVKERNSFLWKISSFDFSGLSDDVAAQPLADLVAHFVMQLSAGLEMARNSEELVLERSVVACLLNAKQSVRSDIFSLFLRIKKLENQAGDNFENDGPSVIETLWRLLHCDYEGLGGRFWVVVFVDALMSSLKSQSPSCITALRTLAHGDVNLCQGLFESLLPAAWDRVPDDGTRLKLVTGIETLLSRSYHSQFIRDGFSKQGNKRSANSLRSFLNAVPLLKPTPILDTTLLVYVAENYISWYEVLSILENQYVVLSSVPHAVTALSAMRHCYRQLGEETLTLSLAQESSSVPLSKRAISLDVYGLVDDAVEAYSELVESVEATQMKTSPSDFEMDIWEERWVELQRELCQLQVVSEFASGSGNQRLQLECSWKAQDWSKVRSLCSSTSLLASVETGDPVVKMSETLLAVADGKLNDVENLHAQTAQLCLYKWQLLPQLASGSLSHASLLHFFHRLVEIRESGQIMVETSSHSNNRTLPDLKNLLNAWRHRLPNDFEPMTSWDEIFSWRATMFSAISSNFSWADPNRLATLHDRPWTLIRMAKTARKHAMRDVALFQLNKTAEERAMNVSDAFLKLREQILAYFNPKSDEERHGGLNLINTTNLSYFDASQKSELFRLKAMFLASLGGRSKANQAYCHSVQICPTHARAWDSWGGLCASLGSAAEQAAASSSNAEANTESAAAASKKVAQYLAQAMGCYLEAVQIDTNEWARVHLPKCLWMLTKDGGSPGVLCSTLESRGSQLPAWVWLPWIPQLLTSFYRQEGRAVKSIFSRVVKSYPQAVYYPLRAFYLERRDVERAKSSSSSASSGQHMSSVAHAEDMMSLLRRTHASLWSSLESILEELLVKFRSSHEEEFLATIIALLERAEAQTGSIVKSDEENVTVSVWKTLGRVAVKYFRQTDSSAGRNDDRAKKTAAFKEKYRTSFEKDFHVSSSEANASSTLAESKSPLGLQELLVRIRKWKIRIEDEVMATPSSVSLIETSTSLAMFSVGDAPDLWPGSCDPRHASPLTSDREQTFDADPGTSQSSTSSSATAARKAAIAASTTAAAAATREGAGGDYGGGSSIVEVPGQYTPNTASWADIRPSPELHSKVMKFEPTVKVLRRNDQLVRRIGMIASDGKTYYFLLQCALPYWTRTDERTAQTYHLLDKVLRKEIKSSQAHLSVQPATIIPVAQRLRLVSDPDSRASLQEIYENEKSADGFDRDALPMNYNETMKKALADSKLAEMEADEASKAEKLVRLEIYKEMAASAGVEASMLSTYLLSSLEGPEPFFQFRRMFAQQWAANCLLQHVFSIVERTPHRVVFIERDGRVLSPDFRVHYNSQGVIDRRPVPFRMTPNISTAIGFPFLDGRFLTSMAMIARAVHGWKDEIDPIFRLLMRDDLVAFYTKSMAKSDSKTQEMERQLVDRVAKNVSLLHARFAECTPSKEGIASDKKSEDPIDQRVRELLDAAQSAENICMLPGSYQGWI